MVNAFHIKREDIRISLGKNTKHAPQKQYINHKQEDEMEIQGFIHNKLKSQIVGICTILTLGILRLMFHWFPQWQLFLTHSRCNLNEAEKVLVVDNYKGKFKSYFVKNILTLNAYQKSINEKSENKSKEKLKFHLHDGTTKEEDEVRIMKCKKLTYIWDNEQEKFVKLAGLENGLSHSQLHQFSGQNRAEQTLKRVIYGSNEINVPVQTITTLVLLEVLTPFYIFQIFSILVWICEFYYIYTVAIVVMSVFGIATSVIQTRQNQTNLKGTVNSFDRVIVYRGDNIFEDIPATDLVPGDVIVIPTNGCEMQCDAVLLNGSCIVNESMLTGESVPITKTTIPNNNKLYNVKSDINHTLFCGTKIIQTRNSEKDKTFALVIRTGYLTTKGELVRSILYPPPADFKFDQDSYKFIGILFVIASFGFVYTIVSKISRNIAPIDILIKALDLITIAVPPALPAAMTVGKLYALNRLKNHKIYCINSRVINVSGSIDCICFDKTGTLTEDNLDMLGVVPVENGKIMEIVKNVSEDELSVNSNVLRGMATCHSLTEIKGEVCGDPLDVKMFEATGWVFQLTKDNDGHIFNVVKSCGNKDAISIKILHLYQFASSLQRMSVITKSSDRNYYDIFCKGSPEIIMSLSKLSTIPENIDKKLNFFTEQGYRVIALATKQLLYQDNLMSLSSIAREEIEFDLTFLGLIILENRLKPETIGVIDTLKKANFKIVMITGDNIQTAINVAKECKIINPNSKIIEVVANNPAKYDFGTIRFNVTSMPNLLNEDIQNHNGINNGELELAKQNNYDLIMTGNSWANLLQYYPDLIPRVVTKGTVFARMSSMQKQQLIEELKNLGYYVAMCGDGANDCGALKAAHVGISLSEAESSVASPFTSQEPNISCIPKVIREGRAALVTSFGVFKLILCYSLTQFASVLILYRIDSNLTSWQFLFIDIALVLNFSAFFGDTKAFDSLHRTPPMTSLLSIVPLSSITLFLFVTILFQLIAYYLIQTFEFFEVFIYNPATPTLLSSYENYSIFTTSMFQYIIMVIVFSKGKPYRQPLYTNKILMTSLILTTILCIIITTVPIGVGDYILELKMPPTIQPRITILAIALLNCVVCIIIEDFFVEFVLKQVLVARYINDKSKMYLQVLDDLNRDSRWPDISKNGSVILRNESEVTTKFGVLNKAFDNFSEETRI